MFWQPLVPLCELWGPRDPPSEHPGGIQHLEEGFGLQQANMSGVMSLFHQNPYGPYAAMCCFWGFNLKTFQI